ncbi:hypothetical protein TNCV_3719341 [Trichonephila clavipes]|nr:hypothetical protein TNCV_3719341 [Trichonephila clavipes]
MVLTYYCNNANVKLTRQVGNPDFACVVRSESATCDGSIRDPSTNPLGKSLEYQFALYTTNTWEEENHDIQSNLL